MTDVWCVCVNGYVLIQAGFISILIDIMATCFNKHSEMRQYFLINLPSSLWKQKCYNF